MRKQFRKSETYGDVELSGIEEWSTYLHNYQNQGLYRNHGIDLVSRINQYGLQGNIYEVIISPNAEILAQFDTKWWHFLYRIARR